MKIGIVIYSQTGNTKSVAEKLKNDIESKGHTVEIIGIRIQGEYKPGDRNIRLESIPKISGYDAFIFGSPVIAFSLSPAMSSFLNQTDDMKNKTVACYVTHAFPYAWMGGNRALKTIKNICENKNGMITVSGIISWSNKKRQRMIDDLVKKISASF